MLFGLVTRAHENTCNQASHTWSDQQVLIGCDVRGNIFFSFLGFCFVCLFFLPNYGSCIDLVRLTNAKKDTYSQKINIK